jgi:hypothetical protein
VQEFVRLFVRDQCDWTLCDELTTSLSPLKSPCGNARWRSLAPTARRARVWVSSAFRVGIAERESCPDPGAPLGRRRAAKFAIMLQDRRQGRDVSPDGQANICVRRSVLANSNSPRVAVSQFIVAPSGSHRHAMWFRATVGILINAMCIFGYDGCGASYSATSFNVCSSERRMWSRISTIATVLGMCMLAGEALRAQTPAMPSAGAETASYRARWMGVYDQRTGDPVEGVRVLDMNTGNSATTSVQGVVNLIYLSEGTNLISLQKIGYEQLRMAVAIGPRDTTPLTLLMSRVTELAKVVTTGKSDSPHLSGFLRGFDERRKNAATGYFITDSVLRREDSRILSDILRARAPNAVISNDRLLKSPSCTWGEGPPQVYLDGVALAAPLAPPSSRPDLVAPAFDLSQFNATELGAIEWYPENSRLPMEFAHTTTRCGALLLWTRER